MPARLRLLLSDKLPSLEPALREWAAHATQEALRDGRPRLLVVPSAAVAAEIRRSFHTHRQPTLGLSILTPGSARRLLVRLVALPGREASLADLRLLAQQATGSREGATEALPPSHVEAYLRAWQQWRLSGRTILELPDPRFRDWADHLERAFAGAGWWTAATVDWELALAAVARPPIAQTWAHGFGPQQPEHYPLLRALVRHSEASVLTATYPEPSPVAQAWHEAWEQLGAEVEDQPSDSAESPPPPSFWLAGSGPAEAEALARLIQERLRLDPTLTVTVAFPRHAPVGRLVADQLVEAGVPFHDAAGTLPQREAPVLLRAWSSAQASDHRLDWLTFFERLRPSEGEALQQLRALLDRAAESLRSSRLTVLRHWPEVAESSCAPLLETWPRLPEEAPLGEYLQRAASLLEAAGLFAELRLWQREEGPGWSSQPVPLAAFLRWFGRRFRVPQARYLGVGNNPLAPVRLLPLEDLGSVTGGVLLLAGLDAESDRDSQDPFLPETLRRALNRQWLAGLESGQPGADFLLRGYLLAASERRAFGRQRLAEALAQPWDSVHLSATFRAEGDALAAAQVGPSYESLYFQATGRWLDEPQRTSLLRRTRAAFPPIPTPLDEELRQARQSVHQQRFDPTLPFGASDGAAGLADGLDLPAKSWERLLSDPYSVWLSDLLRVHPRPGRLLPSGSALWTGVYAHGWLSAWETEPSGADAVKAAAQRLLATARAAYAQAGQELPESWLWLWRHTLAIALEFVRSLAEIEVAERRFEQDLPPTVVPLPAGGKLRVHGRADMVLRRTDGQLWVVDFKTGQDRPLSLSRLEKGSGLQVALYGLALAEREQLPVALSILRPGEELRPQLDTPELAGASTLLQFLVAVQERGVFGGPRQAASRFGAQARYPLALLPLPGPLWQARWDLTYPEPNPLGQMEEEDADAAG